jgi:hypothetical protein
MQLPLTTDFFQSSTRSTAGGLLTVLRAKIAEVGLDGRTIEERLIAYWLKKPYVASIG